MLAETCSDFGGGVASGLSRGGFSFPTEFAPIDGTTYSPSVTIADYKGPGDYDNAAVTGLAGPAGLLVKLDEFNTRSGGSVSVHVESDGSGTITYEKVANTKSEQISGTVGFSCQDHS